MEAKIATHLTNGILIKDIALFPHESSTVKTMPTIMPSA